MQGLIDLSYTPHLIQILADLSPQSPVRDVCLVHGTQTASSTLNLILIAYRIDCHLRGPILAMHAVKEMAVAWAKDELAETIVANKYMSDVLQSTKKGDDAYLFKKWPGGSLITRGGASGTAYAKISAAVLLVDDVDRFKMNIGGTVGKSAKIGEGNPLKLLSDRVSGRFGDFKIFKNSSPKAEGESLIWPDFKSTEQNHFYVMCPRCGEVDKHWQPWEFEDIKWTHENYLLTEEPYILCQNTDCKHKIYERHKYKALQKAEYRPTSEGIDKLSRGYRVSSLYSLLGYPLEQYAKDWLSASKLFDETGDDSEKIRHRNSKQARPWKRRVGKTVNHSALFKTMEKLDPLPENCVILGAGVDLQAVGRIEVQVNGFGENDRYIIDHEILGGDPKIKYGLEGSPWNKLAEFITKKRYKNCHGIEQPIYCCAIDISWGKEDAHAKYFLQNFEPLYFQHIFGVFGKETTKAAINFIQSPTTDLDGFESWGMYSNIKKVAIRNLLEKHIKNHKAGIPDNLHFSDKPCFTEQWFQQLVIEKMNEKGVLEKPHDHSRNEAQDCMYIADAAFLLAFREFENGPDWGDFKEWNKKQFATELRDQKAAVVGNVF